MKWLATALAASVLAFVGFGAGTAAADIFKGYTGPGVWFSPGAMASGDYDWCSPWKNNTFAKDSSAYGLITFIDLNGGWHYGKQGTGTLSRDLSFAEQTSLVKKPHCRNNSSVRYQGGCFAIAREASCA
jgi:hypothetical protein